MEPSHADVASRVEAAIEEFRHAAYGYFGPNLRDAFHASAKWRLSTTHYRALRMIEAGTLESPSVSDLAGALLSDKARASRIVTDLVRDGLVERVIDPADRRHRKLRLTHLGRESLAEARRLRTEFIGSTLSDWDDTDATRLAESIERFNESVRHLAPFWIAASTDAEADG